MKDRKKEILVKIGDINEDTGLPHTKSSIKKLKKKIAYEKKKQAIREKKEAERIIKEKKKEEEFHKRLENSKTIILENNPSLSQSLRSDLSLEEDDHFIMYNNFNNPQMDYDSDDDFPPLESMSDNGRS